MKNSSSLNLEVGRRLINEGQRGKDMLNNRDSDRIKENGFASDLNTKNCLSSLGPGRRLIINFFNYMHCRHDKKNN